MTRFALHRSLTAALLALLVTAAPGLAKGAYMGVYLTEEDRGRNGALIDEVAPDSPAAKAGLRKGDRVLSIDGQATPHTKALIDLLVAHSAGDRLQLRLERDGWEKTVAVTLAAQPGVSAPEQPSTARPPQERGFLGVYLDQDGNGRPVIAGVQEASPAAAAGLSVGDVVTAADGKPVADPSALVALLGNLAPDTKVTLSVIRGGKAQDVVVTLGRRPAPAPVAPRPNQPARPETPDPAAKKPGYIGIALLDNEGKGPLVVDDVQANSPAERFGVRKGDVVVAVDGGDVRTIEQFVKAMTGKFAGDTVTIRVERDGWRSELRVTLGQR